MLPENTKLDQSGSEKGRNALTLRGLLAGIVCVVITCYTVCYAELVVGKIQLGYMQLPPVVIGMLALMLGARAVLGRIAPRLQLKTHEIYTIYVMMLIAAMVSSRGVLEKLIPLLIAPNYFADSTNNWKSRFFSHIPSWVVPWNPAGPAKQFAAKRFYEALRPGERIPWQLWIEPLIAWGIFVALVVFAYLCMASLLRRQWVDNEKLTFPLVQLPLEMMRGDRDAHGRPAESFLANPVTWLGFALPAVIYCVKGLHQYQPAIPNISTQFNIAQYFTAPPWNSIGMLTVYMSFAGIGFLFLLPTDLLFSLWFFYMVTRIENVAAASWGYQLPAMPMYPCRQIVGYQVMGAYVALTGYMLYSARMHLRQVWRGMWRGSAYQGEEQQELMPYRTAGWGLIISILLIALWLHLLHMQYLLALFMVTVALLLVALVMARSTAEAGMLMTETSFRPVDVYSLFADPRSLGGGNLTALAFLDGALTRDQRGLLLTGFLDSLKFADGVQVKRRSLLAVFVLALLLALGVSGYLHIMLPYKLGGVQMYGYVYMDNPVWAFADAQANLAHTNPPPAFINDLAFLAGLSIAVLLASLRTQVAGFVLNPLGYALCGSWTMKVFWFPCLVAWMLKTLILRYGGMKLYSKARPFFLGMILGEFTMAVLFTLPAIINRFTPTPNFPWP